MTATESSSPETCTDGAIKLTRQASGSSSENNEKKDEEASPSNTNSVHHQKSFPNGDPENSIVMKRLKDLCSMKKPTVNVGTEIVGAAYLLKLMTKKRPSGHDDHQHDDDKFGDAMEHAVEATKLLVHADHLRKNALQLLSKSQKLFMTNFCHIKKAVK